MTENAIDPMKIYELQAKLAQAQDFIFETSLELKAKNARLEEKNKEVEELQKLNEERQTTIDSLIEENEKLVGVLRERLGEKETESVLAQNEVKKLERQIAECKARQERASRNIKTDVHEIRKNVVQIIKQLCQLEVEANSLVEMEGGGELGRTAENSTQTENEVEEVEELENDEGNTSVLILGGYGPLDRVFLLDSKARNWKKLRITLPMGMRDFGAVVLNEEIYIFGGYANNTYHGHCYKLKDDGSWIQLASMNQKRSNISSSSLVYNGDIWAIGGDSRDCKEYLKSIEKYNISQDKWTYMPEMNYEKRNAAAAVFKDRIFVTGGDYLKSVEMFDPKLQKWILFCDLPFATAGHTMLISNSTLSIFGGESESGPLTSVWEMDIEDPEKKWTEKQTCSFKHPRSDFGIGKLSIGIIVFGGWGGSGEISEIFDGNGWIDGPHLPTELSCFAYTSISRSLEERLLGFKWRDMEKLSGLKRWKRQRKIPLF